MAECQVIPVRVPYAVIADAVLAIADLFCDLHPACAVELVQRIGVSHVEVDGASARARRSLLQEQLDVAEHHAGERRRVAPGEPETESQLLRVELDRGGNIG